MTRSPLWMFATAAHLVACGNASDVADQEVAALVYADLEPVLLKIVEAGLEAKDTATEGANIPTIEVPGEVSGTLSVDGTVAQSVGENEQLTLEVKLVEYADTEAFTYDSDLDEDGAPLDFSLNINNTPPDNTMAGDLVGTLGFVGEVEGEAEVDIRIFSDLADDDASPELLCTRVTGTIGSGSDVEDLDFVLAETAELGEACEAV